MYSYAMVQKLTKQEEMTKLISELEKIQLLPEIQLNEVRSYKTLFRAIQQIIDNYDFDLMDSPHFKYKLTRTYSYENQKNILRDLKKIRNTLLQKFPNEIIRSFDMAESSVFKKHGISFKNTSKIKEENEDTSASEPEIQLKPKTSEWRKEGNFNTIRYYGYDSNLNRRVSYESTANLNIKQIEILEYKDKNVIVSLSIEKSKYGNVCDVLQKIGFPEPNLIDKTCKTYSITLQNLKFLESFLEAIIKAENSVNDIVDDIISNVKPYLKKTALIPGWIKNGTFQITEMSFGDGVSLNRHLEYVSMVPNKIKEISLLGYDDGDIGLRLTIKNPHYKNIMDILVKKHGCPQPDFVDQDLGTYFLNIKNKKQLTEILTTIQEIDSSVRHLINDIMCSYDPRHESSIKMAFLMGLHPEVGQDSPIFHALKQNEIGEQKLVTPILSFLFQLPEKEKATQKDSEKENRKNAPTSI